MKQASLYFLKCSRCTEFFARRNTEEDKGKRVGYCDECIPVIAASRKTSDLSELPWVFQPHDCLKEIKLGELK